MEHILGSVRHLQTGSFCPIVFHLFRGNALTSAGGRACARACARPGTGGAFPRDKRNKPRSTTTTTTATTVIIIIIIYVVGQAVRISSRFFAEIPQLRCLPSCGVASGLISRMTKSSTKRSRSSFQPSARKAALRIRNSMLCLTPGSRAIMRISWFTKRSSGAPRKSVAAAQGRNRCPRPFVSCCCEWLIRSSSHSLGAESVCRSGSSAGR